jgi:hypothetical protein
VIHRRVKNLPLFGGCAFNPNFGKRIFPFCCGGFARFFKIPIRRFPLDIGAGFFNTDK